MKYQTTLLFVYAFLLTLGLNHYLHSLHLLPFIPFLCLTMTRHSLKKTLWISFFTGIILDSMQSQLAFGALTLALVLSSLILYRQKRVFFHDSIFALALLTFIYSILFLIFEAILLSLFNQGLSFSIYSFLSDFLFMSLLDASLAFFTFSLPEKLLQKIKKKGGFRFIFKKTFN